MTNVATISLDYNHQSPNEYQRLINALVQSGWEYADTSALVYDSENLAGVRLALEVLARAMETAGELSALALQVQLVGQSRSAPAAVNHRRALPKLLKEPLPSASLWGSQASSRASMFGELPRHR